MTQNSPPYQEGWQPSRWCSVPQGRPPVSSEREKAPLLTKEGKLIRESG